jgi:hypothetical protein
MEQARNGYWLLCVSPVRVDDRYHFLPLYQVLVFLGVKARIQCDYRTMKFDANLAGKANQLGQAHVLSNLCKGEFSVDWVGKV